MNLPEPNPRLATDEELHLIARIENKCGVLVIGERKHGRMRCFGEEYLWTLSRHALHEYICVLQKADARDVFHRVNDKWIYATSYTSDDIKIYDAFTGEQTNRHREDVN